MEDMANGFVVGPMFENQPVNGLGFKDSTWMLLLIVAMFGSDEFKEAMMNAAMDKAKEVIERGKQLIPEPEAAAAESAE